MAKKKAPRDDAEQVISLLLSGERQDLLILIVPSHDRHEKPLRNQDEWANAALDLFGELYGGATALVPWPEAPTICPPAPRRPVPRKSSTQAATYCKNVSTGQMAVR